jgi:hypothetical protein
VPLVVVVEVRVEVVVIEVVDETVTVVVVVRVVRVVVVLVVVDVVVGQVLHNTGHTSTTGVSGHELHKFGQTDRT